MPQTKTAVVVGALGVIGRYIVDRLASLPDWQVVGLSRRQGEDRARVRYLSVDLTDANDAAAKLRGLADATHVFYCAFQASGTQAADYARGTAVNLAMLENSVRAVDAAAKNLQRVVLVTGTKYYGSHLGPFKTPAREDDPRHMPPNFYYEQEDLLRERQAGRNWSWSASRPHFVYDFAPERSRNLVVTIGVWAAMCAELGLPLDFPGSPGCYSALMEVTDATQLARAILWMTASENARNQAYNVTDSCQYRWRWLWPRIAAHFNLPLGEVRPLRLADWMKDKEALWQRIVRRHGLLPNALEDLISWPFADFAWGLDSDNITDTTKIRLHGFHGVVDTMAQIPAYLQRYREARILP